MGIGLGSMINKLQITLIVLLIPFGLLFLYTTANDISLRDVFLPSIPIMKIADIPLHVEIANSDDERTKGLSGRKEFKKGIDGMLFVFPETAYHGIWMKDMQFPIDIIWIGEDLTVISIDEGISPNTYPYTFRPPKPVRYVLETEPHYSDTFGIRPGLQVTLPLKFLED